MAALGKKPYADTKRLASRAPQATSKPLERWFAEKWVDIKTGKPCGSAKDKSHYPKCRPTVRVSKATPVTVSELSQSQKVRMIAEKQKAGAKTVKSKAKRVK